MSYYIQVLSKYAVFNGRSRRKEYWYFFLFNLIIAIVLGFIEGLLGIASDMNMSILGNIYSLLVLIPGLAVCVRRLHDTGRSGLWILIGLVPLVGAIVLLVFMVQDSDSGSNQYGDNPKGDLI